MKRGIAQSEAPHQRLERATVPFVCVLRLEHVEAQFAFSRHVALWSHKFEASIGGDEPLDQPGARDPVPEHTPAHDPDPPTHPPEAPTRPSLLIVARFRSPPA